MKLLLFIHIIHLKILYYYIISFISFNHHVNNRKKREKMCFKRMIIPFKENPHLFKMLFLIFVRRVNRIDSKMTTIFLIISIYLKSVAPNI